MLRLQRRLHALGFLEGDCDGIFGWITRAAVEAFQASSGLEATGIADDGTQQALYARDMPESGDVDDRH